MPEVRAGIKSTCSDSCATNLDTGYSETAGTPAWSTFPTTTAGPGTIFDWTSATNPLANFNYVFVFYCTGDTHVGSRINPGYTVKGPDGGAVPVHHLGYQNLLIYLEALQHSFSPHKVVFAGSSAGGFGVYMDYDAVAKSFPAANVYMFDDSGPYLPNADWPPNSASTLADAWNIAPAIPARCTGCKSTAADGGLASLAGYLSATYPNGRMALLSSDQDGEIRQRYEMDAGTYETAIAALDTDVLGQYPNWRSFIMAGDTHTCLLGNLAGDTSCGRGITSVPGVSCGQTLLSFVTQEISGSLGEWTSSAPPPGVPGTQMTWPDHSYCSLGQ